MRPVAALFVMKNGTYSDRPGVDPWDKSRDARKYDGPGPVVCHPPCQRWGRMYFGQPLSIKRGASKQELGSDDGCFASGLAAVRLVGGVIEHPRGSKAWKYFGLNEPPDEGGWIEDGHGGWTCCFEQGRYGHYARKATWLLVYGVRREELPELEWGLSRWTPAPVTVARMGMKRAKRLGELAARGGGRDSRERIATPPAVADILIETARRVSTV